jgi:pullulanase/glycogen debranching enzyme
MAGREARFCSPIYFSALPLEAMTRELASARWETKVSGLVALTRDWAGPGLPPLTLNPPARLTLLEPADVRAWALRAGHWVEGGSVHFFFWKVLCPEAAQGSVSVVGPFNDWGRAVDMERWQLRPVCVAGAEGFELAADLAEVLGEADETVFKFRREGDRWVEPPHDADNVRRDEGNHRNLVVSRRRTDRHVFRFHAADVDPSAVPVRMVFETPELLELGDILASEPLDVLEPAGGFGATVSARSTLFRVFAPRARSVEVIWRHPTGGGSHPLMLKPEGQGAWSAAAPENLSGAHYWLQVAASEDDTGERFGGTHIVDPWARAVVGPRQAAGLVVGPEALLPFDDGFVPPPVEDLVILEGHLRDLLGLADGAPSAGGYRDLARYVRSKGNYLRALGVNALELLPCAEFEHAATDEYHWGYMPVSAFGVANSYASAPGVVAMEEFRDLVRACHEAGLAVIMDVVLNHFGSPNGLGAIDAPYYYRVDPQGRLTNWSGCGNDVRAEAPMFKRLVHAALRHWTEVLGVDGVRLDLAELLGTPLLREIEADFRFRAPHKILIAEPWSFRGHTARDLDHTSWTSWDDAFREFLPSYVRGHAKASDLLHHVAACAFRPSARLRYAQSHDDMAWLDRITERAGGDALDPAPHDILRTRLMHVILLCSAGVPMLCAGQDFLATKRGVSNTWRRGDLNRLDPVRIERFRSEHEFVARLIGFRLSAAGTGLRPRLAVSPGWMQVTHQPGGEAFVAVLNADGQLGPARVLMACNPHDREVTLVLPRTGDWTPVVVSPFPSCLHAPGPVPRIEGDHVILPPLGAAVWSAGA